MPPDQPHADTANGLKPPAVGSTLIIGAGPAGLTAAWELSKAGHPVCVLESDPHQVGGLARTMSYKGFRFDIGGHRFFSKNRLIEDLWTEILGDRMLVRRRLSRIHYRRHLFKYPLEALDAFKKLGPREALTCLMSYLWARRLAPGDIVSFEDWVTSAFGRRLYEIFFKTYTEKVWGIPCSEISADWAAQRIRGFSLPALIKSTLGRQGGRNGQVIKTLIEAFRYPRHGPGEMWQAIARRIAERGASLRMGERVVALGRDAAGLVSVTTDCAGERRTYPSAHVISTMPLRELVAALDPPAPDEVMRAAAGLRYRDFLTVGLIIDQPEVFPDQWIYVHDPGVRVGRIQNFKNWSPEMVPDQRLTMLGLEYFCFDADDLWTASEAELIALARRELAVLKLVEEARVIDGTVVRQRAAYPVYDQDYRACVDKVREFLSREVPNLQLVGRNGMHKYNNQDHAMMTGLMAAWNVMGGRWDVWRVNSDAEYLEEEHGGEIGSRLVPIRTVPRTASAPASEPGGPY